MLYCDSIFTILYTSVYLMHYIHSVYDKVHVNGIESITYPFLSQVVHQHHTVSHMWPGWWRIHWFVYVLDAPKFQSASRICFLWSCCCWSTYGFSNIPVFSVCVVMMHNLRDRKGCCIVILPTILYNQSICITFILSIVILNLILSIEQDTGHLV